MKITQLDIEGFRSLKSVSWKPGDLNVIIGPNGSGKSNLLMMLELISAGASGNLSELILDKGGINALVWDGRAETIGFLIKVHEHIPAVYSGQYRISIRQATGINNYSVVAEELSLNMGKFEFSYERRAEGIRIRSGEDERQLDGVTFEQEELALPSIPFLSGLLRTSEKRIETTMLLGDDFRDNITEWRIHNHIDVSPVSHVRLPQVTRLEKRIAPDGKNLINVLHTLYTGDRDFKKLVNSAMSAAFGDDFDELIFPPASDQRVQLRVRWKTLKREQSAGDLSDGTLRFLLLLAILATPDPPPLIAIDEPETGLHPSMLPIIAEYAVDAAQRTQVIMTTHSDQFLDAFGDTKPTTTVAKWENGETKLTVLGEDELAYWLKEYSLGKLFRTGELEAMA